MTNRMNKLEKILQKEGFIDWSAGTLKEGKKEDVDYDEAVVLLKRKSDGDFNIKIYADNYNHQKYIKSIKGKYGRT